MHPTPPRTTYHAFLRGWKTLLLVHLIFTLIGVTIAAPMTAFAVQAAVSLSGQEALSDVAIAAAIFSPGGALVALVIGALLLTLQLLGYAALLIPARSVLTHGHCHATAVFPQLLPALPTILRISLRFIVWLVLCSLPFVAMVAMIHRFLLGGHDINFYLAEKPPAFLWAIALASLVAVFHLLALAKLATGWVHALPLAIFRRETPGAALRLSRETSEGTRRHVFKGLAAWSLLTPLAASILNLPWSGISMWATRQIPGHLGWLVIILGTCFTLSVITGWLVAACGMSLLAVRNMRLYQESGLDHHDGPSPTPGRHLPIGPKTTMAGILAIFVGTIHLSNRWIENLHEDRDVVVIAHRGASSDAPENTLAAVSAAIEAGADWVEIDVQESADGTVMVFHDSDFKRMRGPAKGVWELRDSEIANIDIGSWKSPSFAAERVPRLAEVLALCKGRCGVLIELKYYGHDQRLEERVVEVVEAAGMTDQVMVMSLSHAGVRNIRQLRPQWKAGLLATVSLGNVTRLNIDFLGLNARTTSRRLAREAASRNIRIYVWTVNDPVDMATLPGRGVDGLITDKPGLARQILDEREDADIGEKLLLDLAAILGRRPPNPGQ